MKKIVQILEGPFNGFYGVVKETIGENIICSVPIFGIQKEVKTNSNNVSYNVPSDAKESTLEAYEKINKA